MPKFLHVICVLTTLFAGIASSQQPTCDAPHVVDEMILSLNPDVAVQDIESLLRADGVTELKRLDVPGSVYVCKLKQGCDPIALSGRCKLLSQVAYAEPNFIASLSTSPNGGVTPNDPAFYLQWGLNNGGYSVNGQAGIPGADIDATTAWETTTGRSDLVVAVIDSGVDGAHPDLVGNLWVNPGEIAGNGLDDDGNGFIDDHRGWDFLGNDNNPEDIIGHGTHVAGIIGAQGDNNDGVTGVMWSCQIMSVKVCEFTCSYVGLVQGIIYAVNNGARVINLSLGGQGVSWLLQDAVNQAEAAGVMVVCAPGNYGNGLMTAGWDIDAPGQAIYPAALTNANILTVAATDNRDGMPAFSNWGAVSVDLFAPGWHVLSTAPVAGSVLAPPNYGYLDGTSMAAPMTAGAVGLLWALNPALSVTQVRAAILSSLDAVPALSTLVTGGGRLDAAAAIQAVSPTGWDCSITQATDLSLTITLHGGQPGTQYYMAHSNDPQNGTQPGAGILFGLHIALAELDAQLLAAAYGSPIFGGTLDAGGSFSLTVPGAGVAGLAGQTWWSVGIQVIPNPGFPFEASPINSITIQ